MVELSPLMTNTKRLIERRRRLGLWKAATLLICCHRTTLNRYYLEEGYMECHDNFYHNVTRREFTTEPFTKPIVSPDHSNAFTLGTQRTTAAEVQKLQQMELFLWKPKRFSSLDYGLPSDEFIRQLKKLNRPQQQ